MSPAPFKLKRPRQQPETLLQRHVATMLRAYLPDQVWWSCSLSGVPLSPGGASAAKAMGMNKGAPDLSFIWPDGWTTYLELKAENGVLTPEQAMLSTRLESAFRVARSWDEASAALSEWMTPYGLRFLTERESLVREGQRRRVA